jgi:hypothetical protein
MIHPRQVKTESRAKGSIRHHRQTPMILLDLPSGTAGAGDARGIHRASPTERLQHPSGYGSMLR